MDDIVSDLRHGCQCGLCKMDRCCCGKMSEAADEIERLRRELSEANDKLAQLDYLVQSPVGAMWP